MCVEKESLVLSASFIYYYWGILNPPGSSFASSLAAVYPLRLRNARIVEVTD